MVCENVTELNLYVYCKGFIIDTHFFFIIFIFYTYYTVNNFKQKIPEIDVEHQI